MSASRKDGRKSHAVHLLPMIQALLDGHPEGIAGIDAYAVVTGPGSFTGIRIGVGVVQGLAMATDRPVIALSSLALLAMAAIRNSNAQRVLVVCAARAGECYVGQYRNVGGLAVPFAPDRLTGPAKLLALVEQGGNDPVSAVGNGWQVAATYESGLLGRFDAVDAELSYDADIVRRLARAKWDSRDYSSPDTTLPKYLKDDMNYRESN